MTIQTSQSDFAEKNYVLSTGTLSLSVVRGMDPMPFRIAERVNPKRAFLFVSTVLGRHIPVPIKLHDTALKTLSKRIAPLIGDRSALVMSYAETATGLGMGIFAHLQTKLTHSRLSYLPTTRFNPDGATPWFEIAEHHSHAVDHAIHAPNPGILPKDEFVLVLVDDESTTGRTFANLCAGLKEKGVRPSRVVLVTLTDWSGGEARSSVAKIFPKTDVTSVQLVSGEYTWTPFKNSKLPALPDKLDASCPPWQPETNAIFGVPRNGMTGIRYQANAWNFTGWVERSLLPICKGQKKILVIGAGEHTWHPFLAGQRLQNDGHDVSMIATTRSPVSMGDVIKKQIVFPDHFGIGVPMYLNNVDPMDWDEIFLFVEGSSHSVPVELKSALGRGWIIDGSMGISNIVSGKAPRYAVA